MVKKSSRKTSAKRRIQARPLSFRHFIRKNFLIIAGLLLLPVTVGAVVSSYNYANLGSAANLFTQTLKGSGGLKPPPKGTLKTQTVASCGPGVVGYYGCFPDTIGCMVCEWVDADGDKIQDSIASGEDSYAYSGQCSNSQFQECLQFTPAPIPTVAHIVVTSTPAPPNAEGNTPTPKNITINEGFDCNPGGCYSSGNEWCKCIKRYSSNLGKNITDLDCSYSSENACYGKSDSQPTAAPPAADTGGGGGEICQWKPVDDGADCDAGFTVNLPKAAGEFPGVDANGNGHVKLCGKPCSVGGQSAFDLQKALKNFFGIFGF